MIVFREIVELIACNVKTVKYPLLVLVKFVHCILLRDFMTFAGDRSCKTLMVSNKHFL